MPKLHPNVAVAVAPSVVSLRCPACRRVGSFDGVGGIADAAFTSSRRGANSEPSRAQSRVGIRVCPHPECREIVFVSIEGSAVTSYPAERLDFEPTDVPENIVASFEEAITGHAHNCFRSAAIMVRRTLEEICADRGAKGKDLKDRLKSLSAKILIPKELLEAADELRLLGNDAAHLEARLYDEIGEKEVEVAIGLCKEILKAVYQLASLLQQLRMLKNNP
jgi:hypothetical protein